MAMESFFLSISNENQHLHGVEIDSLYVNGAGIHVDCRAIRISLSRHLMKSRSAEVNMPCVQEAHHSHWMVWRTHDWCCWRFTWRWTCHRLLNVRLVILHSVFFTRRRWRGWWRTHHWFCLNPTLNTRPTDRITAFLKLQPKCSIVHTVKSRGCKFCVWT